MSKAVCKITLEDKVTLSEHDKICMEVCRFVRIYSNFTGAAAGRLRELSISGVNTVHTHIHKL